MPSSNVKILVVEPSAKIRQEFQALLETADPKRTGQVHFVAKQSAAQGRIQKDSFDVLLVRLDKNDSKALLELAQQKGLVYELLFSVSVQGELLWYFGSLRFGTHKYALRNLQGMGSWWSLKKQDQETPEVYRKLLNRISDGIAEVDVDDTIRWANTALQRALGDVSLAGVSVEQIVKPSDVHQLRTIRQQLNSGVVIPFPVRLATGQLVELDPSFRFGPDGKQLGSSIVFRGVRSNEGTFTIIPELKRHVEFRQVNLLEIPRSLGSFDFVFLRNVMIYFDQPTRSRIIESIAPLLSRDGCLIIGSAESLLGITTSLVSAGPNVYRRKQ